jgi:L-lactate utilization protein LutC
MKGALEELFIKMAKEASAEIFISTGYCDAATYISETMNKNGFSCFASPGVPSGITRLLEEKGFRKTGSPGYSVNLDAGIIKASYAIAETGTLVVNSDSEDVRTASMLPEINFVLLDPSTIVARSYDLKEILEEWFGNSNFTAFITGPSRTADIERVLTLGAHGPSQLHIIMINN